MDGKDYELREFFLKNTRLVMMRFASDITCPFCGTVHTVVEKTFKGCGSKCPKCRAQFYQYPLFGDGKLYARSFTPLK